MIAKVTILLAALAAVNADGLLHGAALISTGASSVTREQDGYGNFAFRSDIDAAGARSSHAEVGSSVAKVLAAPALLNAPGIIPSYGVPTLLSAHGASALVAAHSSPALLSAPIAPALVAVPAAPALIAGPTSITTYGTPLGLGLAYGDAIHGISSLGYGPGVLNLNAVKFIR